MGSTGARIHDRLLDRERLAARSGREHGEVPDVRVVGGVETDDQPAALPRHRTTPTLETGRDIARESCRGVERAAVEPSEEGFRDVGCGADVGRRRGSFELTGAVAADRVDHAGERGSRERAGVDVLIEGEQRTGHRLDQAAQPGGVDERRGPAHRVRTVGIAGAATAAGALAQERNHGPARRELDRPDRDPPEPADALADSFDLTGARGHQPAEHVADRDRLCVGARAAGERDCAVPGPARARRAGRGEQLRELVTIGAGCVPARRPRDDPARFPRHLHFDDARLEIAFVDDLVFAAVVAGIAVGPARAR